eukprot:UN25192
MVNEMVYNRVTFSEDAQSPLLNDKNDYLQSTQLPEVLTQAQRIKIWKREIKEEIQKVDKFYRKIETQLIDEYSALEAKFHFETLKLEQQLDMAVSDINELLKESIID